MTTCPINEPKIEYSCPVHGPIAPICSKEVTAATPVCPVCGCSITVTYSFAMPPVLWSYGDLKDVVDVLHKRIVKE